MEHTTARLPDMANDASEAPITLGEVHYAIKQGEKESTMAGRDMSEILSHFLGGYKD